MRFLLFLCMFYVFSFSREVIEDSGLCKINWSKGFILCEGESAQGQNKYAANLSAKVIAQRNLLEVVKGVNITSEVNISNGLESSEIIKSRVDGVIRGAQVLSIKYDSKLKSSKALVKLFMGKDLLKALLSDPELLSWNEKINKAWNSFDFITKANASTYTQNERDTILKLLEDLRENTNAKAHLESILEKMQEEQNYTGVLLDISEVENFKKALIVKLVDKKGKEIYPSKIVSKDTLMRRNTSVGYMFGLEDARNDKRVFNKPIEIKAQEVYKNRLSNIVLSDEQINQIKSLDNKVLKNAKVILYLGE